MKSSNSDLKTHKSSDDNLAVLKSIQLTPPGINDRHHHNRAHHLDQNGHSATSFDKNNNFSAQQNVPFKSIKSIDDKFSSANDFTADFATANIFNSKAKLSTSDFDQKNGNEVRESAVSSGLNLNFADFENNKIYNAAGKT